MAAVINTNIASLNTQRNLGTSQSALNTSIQRLSSGLRINSAKDDAAGLAISERMNAQVRGLNVAARNANDGISLAQTAEGALGKVGDMLQRMRELAVQSANATNSQSDRDALQAEATQLKEEIGRVASTTKFNGTALLDGSFTAQNFQVGANAGETININSIANAQTSQLGHAISYSASVTGGTTTAALNSGDLSLNGVSVGASLPGVAAGQSAASAFSIAAAINAVSASSGVDATANPNTVTGSGAAITTFTGIAANTFSINGVNVGATVAGGSAAGQGANVAAAINLVTAQTGVTASANAATGALTLTAADGRDISIGLLGTAADSAAASANKTTFLAQTGLASGNVGTQAVTGGGGVAQTVGISNSGTFVTVPGGTGTITNLTASVNGGAFVDLGPIAENAGGSWMNIWAAIEAQFTGAVGQFSHQLFTNGGNTIRFAIGGTAPDSATAAANKATLMTQTGLSSAQLGTQEVAGAVGAAAVAADNHGSITLSSTSASGFVLSGNAVASGGFTAGTTNATATANSLDNLNVATAEDAANALDTIDLALDSVNTARGTLGAVQSRFESAASNIQIQSENLSAARSRIVDADFAAETAALTRGQILQQAGTAMLAQANSLPNNVLSLLR